MVSTRREALQRIAVSQTSSHDLVSHGCRDRPYEDINKGTQDATPSFVLTQIHGALKAAGKERLPCLRRA